ncbi:MAG TPA: hypothetical protein VGL02_28130 [Streptomyces sp.]
MNREPCPPVTSRADVLGQLRRERWLAQDAGETERVAQLDRQIQELSASGSATAPARETAASKPPRATAARIDQKPGPKSGSTKGNRRVSARRPA